MSKHTHAFDGYEACVACQTATPELANKHAIINALIEQHGNKTSALMALNSRCLELMAENAELKLLLDNANAALHQDGHVVEWRRHSYGLEHPVECRVNGLLNCPLDHAIGAMGGAPAYGRFHVWLNAAGFVEYDD